MMMLLWACSIGDRMACRDFVDALNSCLAENGEAPVSYEEQCSDKTGVGRAYYDCLSDAYGDNDCSSETGREQARNQAADCSNHEG